MSCVFAAMLTCSPAGVLLHAASEPQPRRLAACRRPALQDCRLCLFHSVLFALVCYSIHVGQRTVQQTVPSLSQACWQALPRSPRLAGRLLPLSRSMASLPAFILLLLFICLVWKQSHCDPGWLGTHYVDQVSHVELRDLPAFASPNARIEGMCHHTGSSFLFSS